MALLLFKNAVSFNVYPVKVFDHNFINHWSPRRIFHFLESSKGDTGAHIEVIQSMLMIMICEVKIISCIELFHTWAISGVSYLRFIDEEQNLNEFGPSSQGCPCLSLALAVALSLKPPHPDFFLFSPSCPCSHSFYMCLNQICAKQIILLITLQLVRE